MQTSEITQVLDIRNRTKALLSALTEGLHERDEFVSLALLTAVAGESIFLLGPPGVGKSLIARRLKHAFSDGSSFEYLMSKFSTPDEIFGPISIRKLKDEDKYERLTDSYLPGANVVFLDEIWKAGPAIQNALLTILNERIYRNGDQEVQVDVHVIISASNELPSPGSSLDPLWDRFLVRMELGSVKKFDSFVKLITDTQDVYEVKIDEQTAISQQDLSVFSKKIDEVIVAPEVLNTIQVLKIKIDEFNASYPDPADHIKVYDRRWKKAIRLLRTSAFLNGRKQVDLMDCFLLQYCLWSKTDQRDFIRETLANAVKTYGYAVAVDLPMLKKEMDDFETEVDAEIRVRHLITEDQLVPVLEEYYEIVKEDNQFEGKLLSIKQFNALSADEVQVTNLFDDSKNLVNRLKVKKSEKAHAIVVEYNARSYTYPLKTRQKERTQIIPKKPHDLVVKHWEQRYQELANYIEEQTSKLVQQAPDELGGLRNNLFVDSRFAALAEDNQQKTKEALDQLKLRLEKLRFSYSD